MQAIAIVHPPVSASRQFIEATMLVSPMIRSALAAALVLVSADAMKPAFMMEPSTKLRNGNQQRLLANLMAKAQPRHLDQGDDQAADEDYWGFDAQLFSVKYTGCSAIQTYSDEQAEDGDSVLQAKRFVVFRLCPSDSCNKYTTEGCTEDYGEYVLEMGDYLEVMSQYQEERSENFCAYCEWCAENNWNGGNNNNNQNANDDQAQGDDAGRRLDEAAGDDAAADGDDAANGDDAAAAAEEDCYTVCSADYNKLCNNNNNGDDGEQIEIEQFFECVQVENENNGNAYYLGPHCDSDGFSIIIGLYSDATCSTYIGHETTIYDAVGIDLSAFDMSIYYPQSCQSCKENVSFCLWRVSCLVHDHVSLHGLSPSLLIHRNSNTKTMTETTKTKTMSTKCARTCT